jgi:hypothetical protein
MEAMANAEDHHAAGSAGGGSAVGGLAGTNVHEGSPRNADLEEVLGSGPGEDEVEKELEIKEELESLGDLEDKED